MTDRQEEMIYYEGYRRGKEQTMRLIDADELEYDTEWSEYHDGFTAYSQMAIDTAPTIEIVRCKECIFADEDKEAEMCRCLLVSFPLWNRSDHFCSDGKRGDGNDKGNNICL